MKNIAELAKEMTKNREIREAQRAEKTPKEIQGETQKEILKNHEAMLESAVKEDRTKAAKEPIAPLEEYSVEPVINPNEICSFCGEEFTAQGIVRHVAAKHKAPGITLEDINRVNQGEITPPELLNEKGITTIYGLSPEVEKKYFSDWKDTEEDPKASEKIEDPGEVKAPKKIDQEEINLDPDNEKKAKKDSKGNWIAGLLGALLGAYVIVDKTPSLKEKILGKEALGSKESPQSPSKGSYAQHAIDVNEARNNK